MNIELCHITCRAQLTYNEVDTIYKKKDFFPIEKYFVLLSLQMKTWISPVLIQHVNTTYRMNFKGRYIVRILTDKIIINNRSFYIKIIWCKVGKKYQSSWEIILSEEQELAMEFDNLIWNKFYSIRFFFKYCPSTIDHVLHTWWGWWW